MPIEKKFEQSYFTSCKNGLSRKPGYQTKAISSNIQDDARRLIEAYAVGYQIPRDRDQTREDGQPVRLKSFSLGNDQWCVTLTHYRKIDWTGTARGNFFAHSLVCPLKDFIQFGANPFRLYHGNWFKNQDDEAGTQLPLLDVVFPDKEIPLKDSLDRLRQKLGSETRLREMIDAFLVSESLNRPVIIVADPDDVLVLLEGIITLLPLSIRATISFSSYEASRPPSRIDTPSIPGATTLMICSGTTGLKQTGQAYSDIDFDYSYFIFDLESDRFSKIPVSTQFSAWVSGKVFEGDDKAVEECIEFLSLYNLTNKNLDEALAFYFLPGTVRSLDHNQMRTVFNFVESESRNLKQAEKSFDKLVTAPEGSAHELSITVAALGIATRHNLAGVQDVYPRFLRLLIAGSRSRDRKTFSVLLDGANRLPADWRVRLVEDLVKEKVPGDYLLEFVESALKLGPSAFRQEQKRSLFDTIVQLLHDALEQENTTLTDRIRKASGYLQKEEHVLLACRIQSKKSLPAQVSLIENALRVLGEVNSPERAESLGQRSMDLFDVAVEQDMMSDALHLLASVFPLLPALQQRAFKSRCLDAKLNLLWQALRKEARRYESLSQASKQTARSTSDPLDNAKQRAVLDLTEQWLPLLLGDELVFTLSVNEALRRELGSREPRIELLRQLEYHGIPQPQIMEEKQGRELYLVVRDDQENDYAVKQAGNQLQLRRLDPIRFADRFGRILAAFLEAPSGAPERDVIWRIVLSELERKRASGIPPELFQQLCAVVIQRFARAGERLRAIRTYLVPLLAGVADKRKYTGLLVGSVLSSTGETQKENLSPSELRELLRQLDVSVYDVRGIYTRSGSAVLFEYYWDLLDDGRDRSRIMEELVDLYQSGNISLFERLLRQSITSQRRERGAFVCELITFLPALLDDSAHLSKLLEACRRDYEDAWPKFVSKVYNFLREKDSEQGIAALAKQCVARMRELTLLGQGISEAEDEVLDHWLHNPAVTSETADVDVAVVFREVQQFRCEEPDLEKLLSENIQEFQSRKNRLESADYHVAASGILRKFARCPNLIYGNNWKCVEKVATRGRGRQQQDEFSPLIEKFLDICSNRSDYANLLAHVTLNWIYDWDKYEGYRPVLRKGYFLIKDKRSRGEYETMVVNILNAQSLDRKAKKGAKWWEDLVNQYHENSGLNRLKRFIGLRWLS